MESFVTLWLPIVLGILGFGVLILGVRGRQIDDHPLCGRCGFDLFGKPRESTICPESGNSVATKSDVRIGHRERKRGLIYLATAALAPTMLWAAIVATLAIRGVDFIRMKPLAWLVSDTESDTGTRRRDAFAELERRFSAGELMQPQLDRLLDRGLAVQGEWRISDSRQVIES